MVSRRCDPVFWELSLLDDDLAFSACLPSTADGFELDAKTSRGVQQVLSVLDAAAQAGWHEDHLM
jgi:hypothetical protein